jgi:hypothetical protein
MVDTAATREAMGKIRGHEYDPPTAPIRSTALQSTVTPQRRSPNTNPLLPSLASHDRGAPQRCRWRRGGAPHATERELGLHLFPN